MKLNGMMRLFRFDFTAMASPCALHLYAVDESLAQLAAEAAQEEVWRIERKYSRYRTDSELSRINKIAESGGETEVDSETAGLLAFAFEAFERSGGLFDISSGILRKAWDFGLAQLPAQISLDLLLERVGLRHVHWRAPTIQFTRPGMELDFGGIGKEYAVDRASEIIADHGVRHALIDFGGDMLALDAHPDGSPWRIGIRHPRDQDGLMATVLLLKGALASSGDYERFIEVNGIRYCHILNPDTGWPSNSLSSVSVLAERCLVAGCVATIAMLKGGEGPAYLARTGLRHLFMDGLGNQGGDANTS